MPERIPLSRAEVTEVEEEYVLRALRSGWMARTESEVVVFEAEIADRVGVDHALALSSGTAALHLALLELGAGPGKVVLVPSITFAATANAVVYAGAEPVFVDSQSSDGNVDPGILLEAVDTLRTEGHEIAAAITVDLFGRACDYDVIEAGLAERGVPLLEDAAEALGTTYAERAAGSFGTAAILSFNDNKILTTSGGGMLLSNDGKMIQHARKLANQAREPVAWYEHDEIGYNYRLPNILAALGRGQLTRLDAMMARRQEIRRHYIETLSELGVRFLTGSDEVRDSVDNCWLTSMLLPSSAAPTSFSVIARLQTLGVEARHLWKPLHLQRVFQGRRFVGGDTCIQLFEQGIVLPSGSALTDVQVERVTSAVRAAVQGDG